MPNWSDVLQEIQVEKDAGTRQARSSSDIVRRKYLQTLHEYTGRNVIAYYSGFLSKPGILQTDINDEDTNGFMMAVHRLERQSGLDLLLHTPGGSVAATQSIVRYLREMFSDDIRAIVPQMAMSAGTMMACASKEIILAKHSNLGPIDPHLNGIPAAGVLEEFERAYREIKEDPSKVPLWQVIIGQYRPTFLSQCENAIAWSKNFVREHLASVMLANEDDPVGMAASIVERLTDYSENKSHSRHISFDECSDLGLKVSLLENDARLQDLVLTVHHSYMHALMNTPSFKMIENHLGVALVKQQSEVLVQR